MYDGVNTSVSSIIDETYKIVPLFENNSRFTFLHVLLRGLNT